jgi:hypothetical protein
MKYYWGPGRIQDGKLDRSCGRIVIFGDKILSAFNLSMDHNYILRSLAARYRLPKDEVISKAIRLYFRFENYENVERCIVCGVRKIDDEELEKNLQFYGKMIRNTLR